MSSRSFLGCDTGNSAAILRLTHSLHGKQIQNCQQILRYDLSTRILVNSWIDKGPLKCEKLRDTSENFSEKMASDFLLVEFVYCSCTEIEWIKAWQKIHWQLIVNENHLSVQHNFTWSWCLLWGVVRTGFGGCKVFQTFSNIKNMINLMILPGTQRSVVKQPLGSTGAGQVCSFSAQYIGQTAGQGTPFLSGGPKWRNIS